MKKTLLWVVGGLGLAIVCGLAGLAHLSASIATLTLFCAIQELSLRLLWRLPDLIAAWANVSGPQSVGGRANEG